MGIFRDMYDHLEWLEQREHQRMIARIQPDENGTIRFSRQDSGAAKLWAANEPKEKD